MWNESKHIVEPFFIPDTWTKYRCMDWGSAKPYACYWVACDFDGNLYVYRELYGYGCKPNLGTKETARQVAKKIVEIEAEYISKAVLDCACWADVGIGNTIANDINSVLLTNNKFRFSKSQKGRIQMAEQVKARLIADGVKPAIFVFATCKHLIRTLPTLQHNENRPEDIDTNGEDHSFDALGYLCLEKAYKPLRPKSRSFINDYGYVQNTSSNMSWMGV